MARVGPAKKLARIIQPSPLPIAVPQDPHSHRRGIGRPADSARLRRRPHICRARACSLSCKRSPLWMTVLIKPPPVPSIRYNRRGFPDRRQGFSSQCRGSTWITVPLFRVCIIELHASKESIMASTALWILEPRHDLAEDDNPWEPFFDRCFGIVVEAGDEQAARAIGHASCVGTDETILRDRRVFLDPKYTTCVELNPSGQERLIMASFQFA